MAWCFGGLIDREVDATFYALMKSEMTSSRQVMRWVMDSCVSLPMLEMRNVIPLHLPYPPLMSRLCLALSALINPGTSRRPSWLSRQMSDCDSAPAGAKFLRPYLAAQSFSMPFSLEWRA